METFLVKIELFYYYEPPPSLLLGWSSSLLMYECIMKYLEHQAKNSFWFRNFKLWKVRSAVFIDFIWGLEKYSWHLYLNLLIGNFQSYSIFNSALWGNLFLCQQFQQPLQVSQMNIKLDLYLILSFHSAFKLILSLFFK